MKKDFRVLAGICGSRNRVPNKKAPINFSIGAFILKRRYLLSHLRYYHRLEMLNYCVRDGNRCDHFDMFAEAGQ